MTELRRRAMLRLLVLKAPKLLNGAWLLVPLLLWNLLLAGSLQQKGFHNDHLVPTWLLWLEHALRLVIFASPLWLPLKVRGAQGRVGLGLYIVGTLVYCASWLPLLLAPTSPWSQSVIGILGPALTPLVWLLGIGLLGRSWPYALGTCLFTIVHVVHQLIAFEFL